MTSKEMFFVFLSGFRLSYFIYALTYIELAILCKFGVYMRALVNICERYETIDILKTTGYTNFSRDNKSFCHINL